MKPNPDTRKQVVACDHNRCEENPLLLQIDGARGFFIGFPDILSLISFFVEPTMGG